MCLSRVEPGSYEIQNYARYVRHFGAKSAQASRCSGPARQGHVRVVTGKSDRVTAEFDYFADTIDSRSHAFQVTSGSSSAPICFSTRAAAGATTEVRFTLPPGGR